MHQLRRTILLEVRMNMMEMMKRVKKLMRVQRKNGRV
jgi:hypothetical protein